MVWHHQEGFQPRIKGKEERGFGSLSHSCASLICDFPGGSDQNIVFSPYSQKSKRKWGYGTSKNSDPRASDPSENADPVPSPPPPPSLPLNEVVRVADAENERNNHARSVAVATVAAEVVRPTTTTRFPGKSREEFAAIKIQTAFRGYMVYKPKCSNLLTVSDSFLFISRFAFLHIKSSNFVIKL